MFAGEDEQRLYERSEIQLAKETGGWPTARRYRPTLQLEKAALGVETAGVAAERPVAGDDAVAGHHDRDGVVADRSGRGAVGAVGAGLLGHPPAPWGSPRG